MKKIHHTASRRCRAAGCKTNRDMIRGLHTAAYIFIDILEFSLNTSRGWFETFLQLANSAFALIETSYESS